jgi:hypothetical protein
MENGVKQESGNIQDSDFRQKLEQKEKNTFTLLSQFRTL